MKNKIVLVIISIIIFLLIIFMWNRVFNIQERIGNSKLYNKEEIEDAIDIVKIEFEKYPAIFKKIYYNEEKSQNYIEDYAEEYKVDDVIVFISDFNTLGQSALNNGLQEHFHYENWMWILGRQSNENWQILFYGY